MLGDRERQHSTEAEAGEDVWAAWLDIPDLAHIVRGHLLDLRVRREPTVETLGLKAIDRLIGAELASQVVVKKNRAAARVHAEEWWMRAARLDRNQ